MTNAQTEARAIQRYIAPSAGRGAVVQLLKHCDGEWVRYEDHATALAAKDAELAEAWQRYVDANEARIDAEAALAEARKALDEIGNGCDGRVNKDALPCRIARRAREAQGGENNG